MNNNSHCASHAYAAQRRLLAAAAVGLFAGVASAGDHAAVVTFESGWEQWSGTGATLAPNGGNPGGHIHTQFSNFGTEYWTSNHTDFLGDYTQFESVTLSIDVKVNDINFFGSPVSRFLILDLRSASLGQGGYPWSSVWHNLGTVQGGLDWTTFSITFDPNAPAMPGGWGGTGDEHPQTFEPMLPANLTWGDIMASVEQVNFSTYEPGWFYSVNTYFDVQVDNIRIVATPKTPQTPGDLNGDGSVGVPDLLILLGAWGDCDDARNCPADLDGNGSVGVTDLLELLANWG